MAQRTLDVLVVPHTHWDREWYHGAGRFRQRLVALVDELLADEADVPFLLDGQGIVVDDYLAVRPERRDALAARLADESIEAGPWYVLADELIPSGEALVRNLLAGRRTLAALGAESPPVLYCPDSFGHPAALPVLAAGFGFGVVVLWRGYGGRRWPDGDAAWWRGPDGARTLLFHLPPDGYEFGSSLPPARDEARARWERMREVLAPRARLGLVLVQNGADHHARQARVREAVRNLAAAAAPDRARFATLRDFARQAVERATTTPLDEVSGELRDSYGYTWTLQGTFATRAGQKRANARVERLLLREAEPWSALACLRGGPSRVPLVRAAWRRLLECHPHDTLCGCSTDEVARAMDARLEDALAQARGIRDDALLDLQAHDPALAREQRKAWRPVVVVRNAAPRPRGGVAELELLTFLQDVPVGPGSGGTAAKVTSWRGAPVALEGGTVPLQLLSRDVRHDRTESPRHYPDDDLVEAAKVVAWVEPVRGYGTRALVQEARAVPTTVPPDVTPVTAGDRWISNGILSVHADGAGRIRLTSAAHALDIPDLVGFEDVGDRGDTYTHSPVGRVISDARLTSLRVLHRGPLRGALAETWSIRVPAALRKPGEGEEAALPGRSGRPVDIAVNVVFELDAGAGFVRLRVSGRNDARDHRLRIVLRTGVAGATHHADAAFGPVERAPLEVPSGDQQAETPPPTAPLHRWVTRANARHGVALVSDGLAEYEATDVGAWAVTLVRAVGELSRNDLPERPGHAGWPTPTPGAQCPGRFGAILALVPHGPLAPATLDAVERAADDALLPLRGATLRSALHLPAPTLGAELEGEGLAFGAMKDAEDGDGIVLRCVNVTDRAVRGRWRLGVPVRAARLARLDETPLGEPIDIEHDAGAAVIAFDAGARAVVTIRASAR